jgi:MerR family transcriptional regulator/heat shock protein HspR
MDDNLPVSPIGVAADLLGVHPRTLHLYEGKGLLVSARKAGRRYYSVPDLRWVRAIRFLVHEHGLNLEGLRRLLALRAWRAYENASPERREQCKDFVNPTVPCWQSNPATSNCYECSVYGTARDGLCKDEGVPQAIL